MDEDTMKASRSIWLQRGLRFITGANVCVAVVIAAAIAILVNYSAFRHYVRWDVSSRKYYTLSDKSQTLIAALEADVDVIAMVRKTNPLHRDVENLLKEYEYEASLATPRRLRITVIDPDRDLAAARGLRQDYDITDENVILFTSGGRTRFVEVRELVEYDVSLTANGPSKKLSAFRGEQVFSSSIQSVIQKSRPVVCFLAGHGEHDINDYTQQGGYSTIARALRRDNIDVRTLHISDPAGIPAECSALIIAGASKKFSAPEIDILASYLEKNGRLLLLADPGTTIGIEKLLEGWGVRFGRGVVAGLTLTGRELVVTDYGDHPVTRNLKKLATMFTMPRPVEPLPSASAQTDQQDKPHVTILATNTKEGWQESDPEQKPPKFDPGVDKPGPIPIAVAVEKGLVNEMNIGLIPTRIVVIGDSYFASNAGLDAAIGGNTDFFLSAVNWLVAREALLAIGPRTPNELRLDLNRTQMRNLILAAMGIMPGLAALIGLAVWSRRRQ